MIRKFYHSSAYSTCFCGDRCRKAEMNQISEAVCDSAFGRSMLFPFIYNVCIAPCRLSSICISFRRKS
ncbi:hypothetical protein ACEPAH_3648 [Sanghuangporus vaninii]